MLDQVNGNHMRVPLPQQEIVRRIEKALEIDGTHTWQDVRQLLIEGRCQIFWNQHGAWITEILRSPQRRVLNVWVVAGELPEVMSLQDEVEQFGSSHGCDQMVVRGARFGWKHVAKAHGWTEHAVVLRRPIRGASDEQE